MENPIVLETQQFYQTRMLKNELTSAVDYKFMVNDAIGFMENAIQLTITADVLGKALTPVASHRKEFLYLRVPRGPRDWKRFNTGKSVRRWQDIRVEVLLEAVATPTLLFPQHTLPLQSTNHFGRVYYSWKNEMVNLTSEWGVA